MLKMRREHILAALDEVDQLHGSDSSQGIRQAIAVALNEQAAKSAHPMQKPGFLNYPGLSPKPFYDTGQFDWVDELQTACAAIRKELLSVLANDDSELRAYVELPNAQNTAQWQTLNQSLQWSSYHLYRDGEPQQQHCLDCPVTTAAIQHLPLVDVQQHAPEVFFSMLRSEQLRAVLIFEIWHPQLNEGERAAIRTGIEALLGFNQRHGMRLNLKS
jgi:aspartate beta-hydroxylase